MEAESIFQALRNVWIMHSIQVLQGQDAKHSPAIFGYSMLYPLTDNYLDDPSVTKSEKKNFNSLFKRRLQGQGVQCESKALQDVFSMVERMEASYSREVYEVVWESILMIQNAQEKSLNQQGSYDSLTEAYIQKLSFMKGGRLCLPMGILFVEI